MKIFVALVIFLLAYICSVADAGVDPPLFWPVVTEYSDDVCTIRTGYGVRSETGECTNQSTYTATGHGSYYKQECIDIAVGPDPTFPEDAGWAVLKVYSGQNCSGPFEYLFGGVPEACHFVSSSGGYYRIESECDTTFFVQVSLFEDSNCTVSAGVVNATQPNVCNERGDITVIAACNAVPAEPIAEPVATPQAAPVSAPVAAPVKSNTPTKKSSASSIGANLIVAVLFVVIVLAL